MVGYMAWRVVIDTLKPEPRVFAGLSSLQIAAIGVLVYYAVTSRQRMPGPDPEAAVAHGGSR
jgi:hypothetical protein